jgi:uncharacterized membrane protein YoaK (UPF0700 family)
MIDFLAQLASRERNEDADRHLAYILTFVAGAVNAGGFMAVHQYTSHMSGIISSMADNMVLGEGRLVLAGLGAVLSFVAGAAVSAILVNWGRRRKLHGEYALPLALEAALLLLFGLVGERLEPQAWLYVSSTVALLCFIMGLQNAIITKLSHSRIRTTHVTGLVTDMGIEIGKLFYWNLAPPLPGQPPVRADRQKLALLVSMVMLFFSGGILGATAFQTFGFVAAAGLAAIVALMAAFPVSRDIRTFFSGKR